MSNKKNSTRKPQRPRLSTASCETAKALTAIFTDPATPTATKQMLGDMLLEFAARAGVNLDHPALIALAFIESCRALRERADAEGWEATREGNRARLDLCRMAETARAALQGQPTDEAREVAKREPTDLNRLREQLATLERLPENEASHLQLETQIARLEREQADEWPDVIDA